MQPQIPSKPNECASRGRRACFLGFLSTCNLLVLLSPNVRNIDGAPRSNRSDRCISIVTTDALVYCHSAVTASTNGLVVLRRRAALPFSAH
jgi:hypothetical protein